MGKRDVGTMPRSPTLIDLKGISTALILDDEVYSA